MSREKSSRRRAGRGAFFLPAAFLGDFLAVPVFLPVVARDGGFSGLASGLAALSAFDVAGAAGIGSDFFRGLLPPRSSDAAAVSPASPCDGSDDCWREDTFFMGMGDILIFQRASDAHPHQYSKNVPSCNAR